MNIQKKRAFKKGFIAGTLWGASTVFFVAAIFFFSKYKNDEVSATMFVLFLVAGLVLSFFSRRASKKLK